MHTDTRTSRGAYSCMATLQFAPCAYAYTRAHAPIDQCSLSRNRARQFYTFLKRMLLVLNGKIMLFKYLNPQTPKAPSEHHLSYYYVAGSQDLYSSLICICICICHLHLHLPLHLPHTHALARTHTALSPCTNVHLRTHAPTYIQPALWKDLLCVS